MGQMEKTINLLVIEDNPGDVRLLKAILKETATTAYEIKEAGRLSAGLELLGKEVFDCLLLDLNLPDGRGINTCIEVKKHYPEVPVVVLTGLDDEMIASEAVREGAQDYLVKGSLEENVLWRDIRYAIERQKTQKALNEKNEELKLMTQQLWQTAKLATLGELAASIAHELNNPLTTIGLRLEWLMSQLHPDDPQQESIKIIEQEIERMGDLVSNLLEFSRRRQESFSSINIEEEMEKTLELVQFHLRKRNIRIVREFSPDLPWVRGDRQQLRQLFLNLLSNAGDAMAQGGTLTIRTGPQKIEDQGREIVIDIIDTGTGIAPEDLPSVMEPFFTRKAEGRGTGLGLAICNRIVQGHKGVLKIQSELGQGTLVSVALPVIDKADGDQ
jgi:signal transduction histidine kinase